MAGAAVLNGNTVASCSQVTDGQIYCPDSSSSVLRAGEPFTLSWFAGAQPAIDTSSTWTAYAIGVNTKTNYTLFENEKVIYGGIVIQTLPGPSASWEDSQSCANDTLIKFETQMPSSTNCSDLYYFHVNNVTDPGSPVAYQHRDNVFEVVENYAIMNGLVQPIVTTPLPSSLPMTMTPIATLTTTTSTAEPTKTKDHDHDDDDDGDDNDGHKCKHHCDDDDDDDKDSKHHDDNNNNNTSLSTAAQVGIGIAVSVAILLTVLGLVLLIRRGKQRTRRPEGDPYLRPELDGRALERPTGIPDEWQAFRGTFVPSESGVKTYLRSQQLYAQKSRSRAASSVF
ncbi:hypothetical protein GGR57DRAFT_517860 [Xylariaceae sp. FL1272]|nr:hypothetical protein GGR57DRAFT_517860 [Xylariaceae sp. FL1272]